MIVWFGLMRIGLARTAVLSLKSALFNQQFYKSVLILTLIYIFKKIQKVEID